MKIIYLLLILFLVPLTSAYTQLETTDEWDAGINPISTAKDKVTFFPLDFTLIKLNASTTQTSFNYSCYNVETPSGAEEKVQLLVNGMNSDIMQEGRPWLSGDGKVIYSVFEATCSMGTTGYRCNNGTLLVDIFYASNGSLAVSDSLYLGETKAYNIDSVIYTTNFLKLYEERAWDVCSTNGQLQRFICSTLSSNTSGTICEDYACFHPNYAVFYSGGTKFTHDLLLINHSSTDNYLRENIQIKYSYANYCAGAVGSYQENGWRDIYIGDYMEAIPLTPPTSYEIGLYSSSDDTLQYQLNITYCPAGFSTQGTNTSYNYSITPLLSCIYPYSSVLCFDGKKNLDETEIDYGGICGNCTNPPNKADDYVWQSLDREQIQSFSSDICEEREEEIYSLIGVVAVVIIGVFILFLLLAIVLSSSLIALFLWNRRRNKRNRKSSKNSALN